MLEKNISKLFLMASRVIPGAFLGCYHSPLCWTVGFYMQWPWVVERTCLVCKLWLHGWRRHSRRVHGKVTKDLLCELAEGKKNTITPQERGFLGSLHIMVVEVKRPWD